MSDEAALLTAIAAHPDEDTPRLAFADWLDENNQPIRAEFIRLQVEIARIETLPRQLLNRHVELFRRQQTLMDDHRDELLGPLAGLVDTCRLEFRRGFVSELRTDPVRFHDSVERFGATQPLPRLVIEGTGEAVCRLLGFDDSAVTIAHHAELISALRVVPGRTAGADWFGPEDLFRGHHLRWIRLVELDLAGCHVGSIFCTHLFDGTIFPALNDLDLSGNDISDFAIARMLNTGLPSRLYRLILGDNPISDIGARLLAERWPRGDHDRLKHLNLRRTNIGPPGQQVLLERFGGRIDLF